MTAAPESDAPLELRSYGRRRGRRLSARQSGLMRDMLPRLAVPIAVPAPADLRGHLFDPPVREVWLEIGFGGGEHLLWQARRDPSVGLIGAEPFEDGIVKVITEVGAQQVRNVRLHPDDARELLRWLPTASISRAFVLFPDPWPKRRHSKRRLINGSFLDMLARVMSPGAELRIGTDIGDYARTILMAFQQTPAFAWTAASAADWRSRPADWPPTRYEQKALREGRRCAFLRFVRCPS